jgi:hypothetical protein
LSRHEPHHRPYDQELADAIMTDDGSPSTETETNPRSSGNRWKRNLASGVITAAV